MHLFLEFNFFVEKIIDVELKKILSRHERKTLPPLKLRVEGDKEGKIGRKLRELLLKVSLEGGEFEGEEDGQEKMDFMKELGMKTAQREEKNSKISGSFGEIKN